MADDAASRGSLPFFSQKLGYFFFNTAVHIFFLQDIFEQRIKLDAFIFFSLVQNLLDLVKLLNF